VRRLAVALAALLLASPAPAAFAKAKPTLPLADRAAIDATLDVFVPAAIGRRNAVRAWPLATRTMRLGSDKGEWKNGFLPVTPFPVIGTSFHGWTLDSASKDRADIVLLVHLKKGAPLGGVSFNIAMRKVGGRWLVDSAVPAATFAAEGSDSKILAQPDFAPAGGPAYSTTPFSKTGRVAAKWVLIIPGILIGLILLTPVVVISAHRIKDGRVKRERRESDRDRVFRNLPERPN
jgi:hypothetical protein